MERPTDSHLPSLTAPRGLSPSRLLVGWAALGVANAVASHLALHDATDVVCLTHHAVDLGRHLGLGLVCAALSWAWRAHAPRAWWATDAAVLVALAVLAATRVVPNVDALASRLASDLDVHPAMVFGSIGAVVAAGGTALVAVARRANEGWWRLLPLGVAAPLLWLNATVSPYDNPGAHFYLSVVAAVLLAGALGPSRSPQLRKPRRLVAIGAAAIVAAWAAWASFASHSNAVTLDLSRWHSNLLSVELAGLTKTDVGGDFEPDGPFFVDRSEHPPVPPTKALDVGSSPVVVVASIDAVRFDVTTDPDKRKYAPTLMSLAESGTRFTRAWSPGSQTVVTLASIATGKYFSQLYWSRRPDDNDMWPHDDDSLQFATLLAEAGVTTAVAPVASWMTTKLMRGFVAGEYVRPTESEGLRGHRHWQSAEMLTDSAIELVRNHSDGPLFLFLHYLDTHAPYPAGDPNDEPRQRWLDSIRHVDAQVARLVSAVKEAGAWERAVFIVTSDHGEAFGEHNTTHHASTLYEEQLHVPLVFAGGALDSRTVEEPVTLVDLGPTILDLFGLATPGDYMGESLAPLLAGREASYQRPIVAEGRLKQAMVFDDGYKVIRDQVRGTIELYDLRADPAELNNLADEVSLLDERHVGTLDAFFEVHTSRRAGYQPPYRD